MDLKWPLEIDATGELVTVDGVAETIQRAYIVLKTGLGEWLYDQSYGVPHREMAQRRPAPLATYRAAMVRQLLRVPGLDKVERLALTEQADRTVLVEGAIVVSGVTVEISA